MVNPKMCVPKAQPPNVCTTSTVCNCIGHKYRVAELKHTHAFFLPTTPLVVKIWYRGSLTRAVSGAQMWAKWQHNPYCLEGLRCPTNHKWRSNPMDPHVGKMAT